MILYLVRHGETAANRDGLGLGRSDLPLTARGSEQAAAIAAHLAATPLDRVYSSPLQRASVVASTIADGRAQSVELRHALIELDVGETDGLPIDLVRQHYPGFLAAWSGPDAASTRMPGGESLADLQARLIPFLDELAGLDAPAVAVVSHNFVLRVMLCHLLGLPILSFRSMTLDLGSVSTLSTRNGRTVIRSLNDTCHLTP